MHRAFGGHVGSGLEGFARDSPGNGRSMLGSDYGRLATSSNMLQGVDELLEKRGWEVGKGEREACSGMRERIYFANV